MSVPTVFPRLDELATELRALGGPLGDHWEQVRKLFDQLAAGPGLLEEVRAGLRALPPDQAALIRGRARETTTHFAWCLSDNLADHFSFWLNEYKPQRDWLPGYADSIHNHRYHFCTTILRGNYVQEFFAAELAPGADRVVDVTLLGRVTMDTGAVGALRAEEFHRIPSAGDHTTTLLLKSRPAKDWSLSFEPDTRTSRQHIPVEVRLIDLADRI